MKWMNEMNIINMDDQVIRGTRSNEMNEWMNEMNIINMDDQVIRGIRSTQTQPYSTSTPSGIYQSVIKVNLN